MNLTRCFIHQTNSNCLNFHGIEWFYVWLRNQNVIQDQSCNSNCGTPCMSPPWKKLKRCEGYEDLALALEGVQDVERKEIRELEVRLKKIEVRQCRLLHIIIRCYVKMSEVTDSLSTEASHVRSEIKKRKDALERLVSV